MKSEINEEQFYASNWLGSQSNSGVDTMISKGCEHYSHPLKHKPLSRYSGDNKEGNHEFWRAEWGSRLKAILRLISIFMGFTQAREFTATEKNVWLETCRKMGFADQCLK